MLSRGLLSRQVCQLQGIVPPLERLRTLTRVPPSSEVPQTDAKKTPHSQAKAHAHVCKNVPPRVEIAKHSPRVIADDNIEQEIERILSSVRPSITKPVDQKEVDQHQQLTLGPFWKQGAIAPGLGAHDMRLVFCELPNNAPEPTTENGIPVSAIITSNHTMKTGQDMIVMVGRSGCGKTATILRSAREHYLIYMSCCAPYYLVPPEMPDINFKIMAQDITQTYEQCFSSPCTTLQELIERDSKVTQMVQERLKLEILCRLLFLLHLFRNNPNVTPEQFFRAQVNGGVEIVTRLVFVVKKYSEATVELMLLSVYDEVRKSFQDQELIIALDEASLADYTLPGKLISPTALAQKRKILDRRSLVLPEYQRGMLTAMIQGLDVLGIPKTVMIAGTGFSLAITERVFSSASKRESVRLITRFPASSADDVERDIGNVVNLENCSISEAQRHLLSGRKRYSMSVVANLADFPYGEISSKQQALNAAVRKSIQTAEDQLTSEIRSILACDKFRGARSILQRILIGETVSLKNFQFTTTDLAFFDHGLCGIVKLSDSESSWRIEDPLVLEAIRNATAKDPTFVECIDILNRAIALLDPNCSTKGKLIEPIIRLALAQFNGQLVSDLPFIKSIEGPLPLWCYQTSMNINKIQTSNQDDLAFLTSRPLSVGLVPLHLTRPDFVWFFAPQLGASLSCKFQTDTVEKSTLEDSIASTNLHDCFSKNGRPTSASKDYTIYKQYLLKNPLLGSLRIHIIIPNTPRDTATSRVVGNDVLVFITIHNLHEFFVEQEGSPHKEEMQLVKCLIHYLTSKDHPKKTKK